MKNEATEKLSPLKPLTSKQSALIQQIMNFTTEHLEAQIPQRFLQSTVMPVLAKVWFFRTFLMNFKLLREQIQLVHFTKHAISF